MVDRARVLAPDEVTSLIGLVEGSRSRQIERVQAVESGVRIAAEQVQDTRLQLLESPPPVDLTDVALQVGLTLIFETTILGAVSGLVTNALLRPLLRSERTARVAAIAAVGEVGAAEDAVASAWLRNRRSYPLRSVQSGVAPSQDFQRALSAAEASLANAQRAATDLAVQAERASSTLSRFSRVVGGQEGENVGGAIQAAAAGLQATRKAPSAAADDQTKQQPLQPGAQLQAQAAAWSAGWRLSVHDRHDAFAARARKAKTTLGTALDIEEALDPAGDIGPALEGIRSATTVLVEALIWARLYANELPPSSRFDDLARFASPSSFNSVPRLVKLALQGRSEQDANAIPSDIDSRLRDYWTGRFGDAAMAASDAQLAAAAATGVAPAGLPLSGRTVPGWLQQSAVLRWLSNLNDRYAEADRTFTQMLAGRR
jgi:hypothetical protein